MPIVSERIDLAACDCLAVTDILIHGDSGGRAGMGEYLGYYRRPVRFLKIDCCNNPLNAVHVSYRVFPDSEERRRLIPLQNRH